MNYNELTQRQWKLVCEEYLCQFSSDYILLHSCKLRQINRSELLDKLKSLCEDSAHFTHIRFVDDSLMELIITEAKSDPFEGEIVKVHKIYSRDLDLNFISNSLRKIDDFYKKSQCFYSHRKRILLDISADNLELINNLKSLGLRQSASRLLGDVDIGLEQIKNLGAQLAQGYEFRYPCLDELNEITRIETDVHAHEPSSVLNYMKPDKIEVKRLCCKLIKEKKILCLYHKSDGREQVAGFIGHGVRDKTLGLILNIAISRKFQNKRLTYHLYEKALLSFQELGIKKYYGFSATHKVLQQAARLGRFAYNYQYEYRVAL